MDAVKARRKGLVQELRKLARSCDVQAVRDDSGWAKVKAMYEDTHTHTHTRLTVSDSVGGDHAEFHCVILHEPLGSVAVVYRVLFAFAS